MKQFIIAAMLLSFSFSAYAFIPKRNIAQEVIIHEQSITFNTREEMQIRVNTDCNFKRLSEKEDVKVSLPRGVKKNSPVVVSNKEVKMRCDIISYSVI